MAKSKTPFAMVNPPAAEPEPTVTGVTKPAAEALAAADEISQIGQAIEAADKAQNSALADALAKLAEMSEKLAKLEAAQAAQPKPPAPEVPEMQKPEYAAVEQTPPVQYVEGERGWIVSLPRNPEAFVAAREGAHDRMAAIEVYKARMGIRSSIHPFAVQPAVYQKPAKEPK